MQKLVWQNANGVELDLTSGNYGITEWEGFSNASLNIQSQQVPFQDGGVFLDALIEQRELSVTLAMQDNNNLGLRYQNRRELISALNPKLGEGYLIYTNDFISKRIKCVPQIPLFETHNSDTVGTPKASLSWTACEPYWEDSEETEVEIGAETTIVQNNGDIPCQIKAELNACAIKPILFNKANNKEISIEGAFWQRINISTTIGQKEVLTQDLEFEWTAGGTFFDVCYGKEKMVVAGGGAYSIVVNALTGESHSCNVGYLRGICFSNRLGIFVAVGGAGRIFTSSDAETWTEQTSGVNVNLKKVCYSEKLGLFAATGESGRILTSPDGITWTVRKDRGFNLNRIRYFESQSIFMALESTNILTSTDGITWNRDIPSFPEEIEDVTYSEKLGLYVIVGRRIWTSSDGEIWTETWAEGTNPSLNVVYSDYINKFVVSGSDVYNEIHLTSSDGITWTQQETEGVSGGVCLYVNALKQIIGISTGIISTSYDGITWNLLTFFAGTLTSITYIKKIKKYVLLGINLICISEDGVNWEVRNFGYNFAGKGIAYSDTLGVYVIAGSKMLTSSDMSSWTETNRDGGDAICYSEELGLFVGVGSVGRILTSPDGINWTQQTSGVNDNLRCIIYKNGLFVAVGYSGIILTSSDGITWTQQDSGVSSGLEGVSFAENTGLFVVVGRYSNVILTSADGVNWVKRAESLSVGGLAITCSARTGMLVVVGEKIWTSLDGINWVQKDELFDLLISIAVNPENDLFVVVGLNDIMSKSYTVETNIISQLTPQSDMTFNLEKGNNEIMFLTDSNSKGVLKYRQKYIGV